MSSLAVPFFLVDQQAGCYRFKNMKDPKNPHVIKTLEQMQASSCCRKGCSYCCYEPLYVDIMEAQDMLEPLTADQKERVKARTRTWIDTMQESGLLDYAWDGSMTSRGEQAVGMSVPYRRLNLPCPFLENKMCMVYERRPINCRTFFAKGNPEDCGPEERRRKQLYAEPSIQLMGRLHLEYLDQYDSETVRFDHLGSQLAALLFAEDTGSKARVSAHVSREMIESGLSDHRMYEKMTGETVTIGNYQEHKNWRDKLGSSTGN